MGDLHRRVRSGLTFAAALLLWAAGSNGPADPATPEATAAGSAAGSAAAPYEVLVARRGWHVDVGLAVETLGPALAPLARQFPRARYLFFGFGDLRYLLSRHRHGPVLLAALWPGRALLLITAISDSPEAAFGASRVERFALSAPQAQRLQRFLVAAFAANAAGEAAPDAAGLAPQMAGPEPSRFSPYAPGPYDDSAYYLASARYSAVHTCNTWVAESLQAAGLPIRSRGVLLASQLWRRVRRLTVAVPPPSAQHGGLIRREAVARSGTPPSSGRSAAPRRSSSAARAGSSC